MEPAEKPDEAGEAGQVVRVASWSDPSMISLKPHEPQPTDTVVVLEPTH